jgi:hypothetical protein
MLSSPRQVTQGSGGAYSPQPYQIDPDDEPRLLDFDWTDNPSREASVEVLDCPADQESQSGEQDIVEEDIDGLESDADSIHQGVHLMHWHYDY